MADSSSRDWPPGLSDLRLACEECHKRKIRCEAPQERGPQGACQACRANHRTCLFSLKNKTGRPRKPKPTHLYRDPKTLSPHTLEPRAGIGMSAATITGPHPSGPRHDWASRTRQHVSGHQSSAAGHYETPKIPPYHVGSPPAGETSLGQLSWLSGIGTGRSDFGPLLDSPCGGDIQASTSPGFLQLGDDFVLEMPGVMTSHPNPPDPSGNERPGSESERLGRPYTIAPGTTPSTEESSDRGDCGDFWRTGPARDGAGVLGDNGDSTMSEDFFDTMRLCGEMNNGFQSRVLDVTAPADKQELSIVLANIEELGHKTVAAMRDAAGPPGPPSRQEQYKRMLTRVAVLGAVDIAADLVKHNLSIHNIRHSGGCEAENDGSPDFSTTDLPREGKDHDGDGSACINASAEPLESVLSLVRLDYALLQFFRFLSANQCEGDGCHDPSRMAPRSGHSCSGGGRTSPLARTAQTRAQLWALVKGIRKLVLDRKECNVTPSSALRSKMGSPYVPHGTTTRLTPADEAASSKAAYRNMEQQAFHEWPNEAGFDGLTEHRGPIELKVSGNIPAWAAGSLYRTGPGQCKVEDTKSGMFYTSHWFDGLAHTHRFDIVAEDGSGGAAGEPTVRVYYSSRRQSDKVAADIKATGTLRSISFAQRTDPCVGLFGKFMSVFNRRPTLYNVGVTVNVDLPLFKRPAQPAVDAQGHRAASIVIGTDAGVMCEMDPKTMDPVDFPKHSKFHPDLKGPLGGAHGKFDQETGDYINYNLELGKQPVYRVFQVSAATGKTDILATIPYKAAFIHSFFMTRNYVVLLVPVAHYQWKGGKIVWEGNLHDSLKPFDPAETCRWFVVDRRHGKGVVAEFASPARFFFHTVNAFEDDDGDVFCEVTDYPNRYIVDCYYYDVILDRNGKATEFWTDGQLAHKSFSRLARYRLRKKDFIASSGGGGGGGGSKDVKLPTPEIVMEVPAPHAGDMPVINPRYRGRKHRYGYFLVSRVLSTLFDGIAKIDTETRELLRWEGPRGHTPGEAIFVPRPATAAATADDGDGVVPDEDDGVLLSVVLDGANRTSYLLCLDARTMTELGRAECEFAVAIGLHGRHVAAAS
ncbi:retinal pigment epithelial membrane protein-domain-containing protein [Chaetomium fimeti]|uniref:Retinal pigment epithelial membrane protein-domain-containing protein n=1 Tax=Chaetomium fimeti TaxID=1854472 RepID=A0AAE0LY29_9PEZI|nr:retinal pigment epithelial membrane protein-domain-containing protein [Chaetomium fimeti]